MALINCAECGKEISDKSTQCIHCGNPIVTSSDINTTDSNISSSKKEIASSEVYVEKTSKNKKRSFVLIIFVFAIIITSVGAYLYFQNNNSIYNAKIIETRGIMAKTVVGSLDVLTMVNNIWHDAIFDEYKVETSSYVFSNNLMVANDFNEAIGLYYDSETTQDKLDRLDDNLKEIQNNMKELNSPTPSMKEAYEIMKSLHEYAIKIANLAKYPTGSYDDFSDRYNTLIDEFETNISLLGNEIDE